MKLLYQLIIKFWFILILTVGIGQERTGCMDDGYQQWSPNLGSPACNYDPSAIIEGVCLYNDCLGYCQEVLGDDGNWVPNNIFTDKQYDACGICGGDNSSCEDCFGVPNGKAYINHLCIGDDNEDGCVGGEGISDCLSIEIKSELESNSYYNYISILATNLDTLNSLNIEFTYDSNIIHISGFSLYGTALNPIGSDNYDYEIAYDSFIESGNFIKVNFILYFEPHNNLEKFLPDGKENIFNIVLETMEVEADTTTQIIINELSVNEILMDDSNWVSGNVRVEVIRGCTDDGFQDWSPNPGTAACNYDPDARQDDGNCAYEIDCFGECGGDAVYDVCDVCGGTETDLNNCSCTEANIVYDCNQDCAPIEGCPEEFSFTTGCAFKDTNCSDICVGGATERYPCEMDCAGEWGGIAYEDDCDQCIADLNDIDCFNSSFDIYNSNGYEIDDSAVKESDIIYVVLHVHNLPHPLEGLIIDINYNSNDLFLNNWSLNPEEFDLEGALDGELNNSNELYIEIDSTFIDSTIFKAVIYTTNELYQGNDGNMLFLHFFNIGNVGDSTVISYNKVQVNEHVMKKQNYTEKIIYFGDCHGVFNGGAQFDECGVCGGDGPVEGFNCDGEPLSIHESLIPQDYTLSQNYPNPFNPITYIHYRVPNYNFVTIDIINISGQIIKTIVQSLHQPGNYEIMWDGTNYYGISVPSGIYFYKMDADEFVSVKKLVLLK